jgi:hypothetical protein
MNITWQTKTFIIGGVVGVLIGTLGAYIVIQAAEKDNTQPKLTAGDGVKVALGVMTVLRLLADLGSR